MQGHSSSTRLGKRTATSAPRDAVETSDRVLRSKTDVQKATDLPASATAALDAGIVYLYLSSVVKSFFDYASRPVEARFDADFVSLLFLVCVIF